MTLRQVSKGYSGSAPVLHDVDLDVGAGQVIAVTGRNGSGKSTLLRIVAGLSSPTSGVVHGRPGRVGYVPERFPSHQRMPAISYLAHMGRIQGLPTRRALDRAHDLLRRLELVGGAGTPLRQLSKGNAQKVAIAQALLAPPDLLVLDEPWSGLDTAAHASLRGLIEELAARGGAVVFTDHREAVVEAGATTVLHLDRGRLAAAQISAPVATIVLVDAGRAARVSWERAPGVRSAARTGPGTVTLEVAGERCEELLLTAIRAGWSVHGVRRPAAGR